MHLEQPATHPAQYKLHTLHAEDKQPQLSGVDFVQVLWRAAVFRFDWYTVMLQLVSCILSWEATECCTAQCGKAEVCGRAEQVVLALSSIAVCGNILPQARLRHNQVACTCYVC